MNKKLAIAAAVAATFASASYAQSSVTLYGIVDAGITYTTNIAKVNSDGTISGNRNFAMTSGNLSASRWGLRGSEDLGGGLRAIFTLESGFDVSNGKMNGSLFNRQSYVGLSQDQYGTVTFGRQFDGVVDYLAPLSAAGTWGGTYMAHNFDNDNLNGSYSINNSVKFRSANYSGFEASALYGFSNQAGGFANNRAYSFGAGYNYGGLRVGAAYTQAQSSGGFDSNANGAVVNTPITSNGLFGQNQHLRTWGAGANYAFGPAVAGVLYTQTRVDNQGARSTRINNIEVNGRYNLTPALGIGAMYAYTNALGTLPLTDVTGSNSAHWHQFGLQADYALSKRTDIYLEGVGLWGAGTNATLLTQVGYTSSGGVSASKTQGVITTGIRHRF
ncbi:porin [Paraburkholderia flagellata]|uniref:porin n=1 Tax=Paraburkholderia flagellata TaxID=2883241 RepID=UPI001F432DA5|nr:porin [Paraburkholderia flagellata]